MDFLREALSNVRRLDDQPVDSDMAGETEFDLDAGQDMPQEPSPEEAPSDAMEFDLDAGQGDEEHPELDDIADEATEDPNRAGLIRTVKGAHLVYKREAEEGQFEELWIYNVDDLRKEMDIKKAILAGTDIPPNKMSSPDGSQTYEIWSAGNAELLMVRGLPS